MSYQGRMPQPKVAVIIPAFQEAQRIAQTLRSIPPLVEQIYVVDDASTDGTADIAARTGDTRTRVLTHPCNLGVGAAITSGYRAALASGATLLVVMAGDNQMDPADLPTLLEPLVRRQADYVKGNRLIHPRARDMPRLRRLGTRLLAHLTSWAARQRIHDSQCGYTAVTARALHSLDLDSIWRRYGYPNDLIVSLAKRGCAIVERPVRPVYQGERSGLRPWHAAGILYVIARRLWLDRRARGQLTANVHGEFPA